MAITKSVVNQISKRISADSYTSYPIGAEARYVGAQRSSNNNNLEEQLLVGTDYQNTRTFSSVQNSTNIKEEEVINFRKDNGNNTYDTNNFYTLTKTTIKETSSTIDPVSKKLTLNLSPKVISQTAALTFKSANPEAVDPIAVSNKTVTYNYSSATSSNCEEKSHIANSL